MDRPYLSGRMIFVLGLLIVENNITAEFPADYLDTLSCVVSATISRTFLVNLQH